MNVIYRALSKQLTRRTLTALISASVLVGCTTPPPAPSNTAKASEATPTEKTVPARPFPAETLYSLLVAEMASHRDRFDITLGNYVQQAHRTRDLNVVARATRIARYLEAKGITLEMALLWVELDPKDTEARYIATTELGESGRLQEAFDQAVVLYNDDLPPLFQTIAAKAGQLTDIQREVLLMSFNDQLQLHPKEPSLLVGQGLLRRQQGQLEQALSSARKALAIDQRYIDAAILEAQLLSALKRQDEALKTLLNILRKNPDNKRLRLQYARLLTQHDLDKAHQQFQQLVEQSPDDADLILSLALISAELKREAEAQSLFQQLLLLEQHQSTAHFYLGYIAETREQYDSAIEHYYAVTPDDDDFLRATLQASHLLLASTDNEPAKALNLRLTALRHSYPERAEQLFLLESEALLEAGLTGNAAELLNDALDRYPANTSLLYSRAMAYDRLGQLARAEQDFRTLLRYDPNNASALNALGYTLADRTERHEEAYELIHKALQLEPDDPAIMDSMGWVQYHLGNYTDALIHLREAFKQYPNHEVGAHLGEVLWVTGAQQDALQVWQQGLQDQPNSDIIQGTMRRLGARFEQPTIIAPVTD